MHTVSHNVGGTIEVVLGNTLPLTAVWMLIDRWNGRMESGWICMSAVVLHVVIARWSDDCYRAEGSMTLYA